MNVREYLAVDSSAIDCQVDDVLAIINNVGGYEATDLLLAERDLRHALSALEELLDSEADVTDILELQ